jgi:hypothetical protein
MNLKNMGLGLLLAGIAVVGPLIAYAGVSVIYPSSPHTADVNTSPPITFDSGADYTQAASLGFAGSFTQTNNDASFTITLSGLSGGTVTIDKYTTITATDKVDTFKMQVASALTGTLTAPTVLKIRVWDPAVSATAPSADGDANVCAYLSLAAALNTESSGPICGGDATYNVQVIYQLPNTSSGSSAVSIRPSSIAFV